MTNDESNITCVDFRINRDKDYPTVFFCAKCKNWEDLGSAKGRCKRASRAFKCAANELSLSSPFQKKKEWCRMIMSKNYNANTVCISIDNNNKRIKTIPWLKRDELIDKQHDKIELLEKKLTV